MSESDRPNPDALLSSIQREEAAQKRGRLKVFLGMCPGVGKTYAMLEAAQRELKAGRDLVIGYVETHGRKETDALAAGLPLIPRKQLGYRGVTIGEMDLDAVLARRPQLALVDELAHTNVPGARHPKRWQDVAELLDAGIDVFTTLNVQHVESRADTVRQVTGAEIRETVPDSVLDDAVLELVDLPPAELVQRLHEGKVYLPDRAAAAARNFFREANLTALRELSLRLLADHVGQDVLEARQAQGSAAPWKSSQRLLVGVSASPTSASLVRWTRRLAGELQASWLAVYVESTRALSAEDQTRLARHLALARELGAEIVATTDDDVVRGILRAAREHNATQIVVGKPADWRVLELFRGGSMLNRLIRESGNIDIHAVRAEGEMISSRPLRPDKRWKMDARACGWAALIVAGVTGLNAVVEQLVGIYAVALSYLLAIVALALFVGRVPVLFAAALSAVMWNFFFLPPRYTFFIAHFQDGMMFAMYFIVALVLGELTARIRAQQAAERQREQRATALYLLTRELAESPEMAKLLAVVIQQVGETFHTDVALSLPDSNGAVPVTPYFASSWSLSDKEQTVAAWAFLHRQAAGRDTDNLPASEGLHLPLVVGTRATGVLSLRFHNPQALAPAQRDLLDAFVRQIALVLDRERLRDAETQAKLLAESERMGTMLLNSVSHELRTPLAAINSAASGLRAAGELNSVQQNLAGELDEATRRLNRIVQNLLDLSRLEAGHLRPNPDWHDLRDLVNAALQGLGHGLDRHEVKLEIPHDLPPVKLDAVLTEQILANLFANAAAHTPPETSVAFLARAEGDQLVLRVSDNGPGLPDGDTGRIFDRFQRGPGAVAGGTGIGLSLVKGFTEMQGGSVSAENRPGGGAMFTVKLPLAKLPPVPEEQE